MTTPTHNAASQWFQATEALGDFMGIRYGRIPHGSLNPEWFYISHVECDGIGGFARLLRQQGATIARLPSTKARCRSMIGPIWRLWKNSRPLPTRAQRGDWLRGQQPQKGPPKDLAWHLFSEPETKQLLDASRRLQVTINSLLLRRLDAAIRPELGLNDAHLPWMVPVNLRDEGKISDDTSNQVSCLEVFIGPDDTHQHIHQQILKRLADGEHHANFLLMQLGSILSLRLKMRYLAHSRTKPAGNIGAFSNLGSWDPHKQITPHDSWLFCPPLATGQRLAAGCVTFQNRLSLTLQAHPDPSGSLGFAQRCMNRWTAGLDTL